MIKKKITTTIVKETKGILTAINEDGLQIKDEKTGKTHTVKLELFEEFLGEEISLSVKKTEKEEIFIDSEDCSEDESEECCACGCNEYQGCVCVDECICPNCKDNS
jgi:hypothetical protein